MKKVLILATAMIVAVPVLALGQSAGYYDRSYTRLSYVKGDVYVQRVQDLGYEEGEVNLVVVEGDKIGTRDGFVEVQLGRRNYLRLDRDTQVDMVGLPRGDYDPTKLHVLAGRIYVRVNNLDREKNLEIHTPDASFYVLDEGLYRVDVLGSQMTEFLVYEGQAEAAAEEGSVVVGDGEMVAAANGRLTSDPVGLRARRDDFSAWNDSRDGLYARRTSRTYLPSEYSEYESELADYGRWVNEGSYGYVWVPTASYDDWRPYYNGRWVWYPIIGWNWVAYEPWGWCTTHYGRWGWRFGLGWYWIPQNHWNWGPAWVHWWHGYDQVGWCPLSYYNYPGVIVNNYFYDRYNDNYFPNNSRSLTVVNKNQLQNRRISQVALGSNALNRVGRISLRSAQPDLRPSLNRENDIALRARKVLNKEGLRSVGRNFGSDTRRVSSDALRSSAIRRAGDRTGEDTAASRGRVINSRELDRPAEGGGVRRIERPAGANPPEGGSSRVINERVIRPRGEESPSGAAPRVRSSEGPESGSGRRIDNEGTRVSPARSGSGNESPRSPEGNRTVNPGREVSPSRLNAPSQPEKKIENNAEESARPRVIKEFDRSANEKERATSSSPRKREGEGISPSSLPRSQASPQIQERPVTSREFQPRSVQPTSTRSGSATRVIKERGGSAAGSSPSSSTRRIVNRDQSMPSRTINPVPRSTSTPSTSARSYSTPSRSYSAPSRTVSPAPRSNSAPRSSSAPSRSYNAPSRTVSPSRSLSTPSRTTTTPSRSYAPSRSYSAPSRTVSPAPRSYSAPRSSPAPSRSYSALSRSSSAPSSPSRSYSAPSRSSGSSSAPSRSYSAPSRSSSSPSRSSSAPSRSSSSGSSSSRSSGGSVRKK